MQTKEQTLRDKLYEAAEALQVCVDFGDIPDEVAFYIELGNVMEWSDLPEDDKLAIFSRYVLGDRFEGDQLVHTPKSKRETIVSEFRTQPVATLPPAGVEGGGPRVQCRQCKSIIQSTHVHHYAGCACKAIAIDGGGDYTRCIGEPDDFIWIDAGPVIDSPVSLVQGEVVDELPACDHPIAETIRQEFRVKDAHTANKHVYTVRAIQHAIDDVAEQAHRTLKQLLAVLNWVERKHKYDLRDQCIAILEQAKGRKRKYVDFEAGRVSLGQTGGPKMHDKAMLEAHLATILPPDVYTQLDVAVQCANEWLEGSGGQVEWRIKLDHKILKELVKNGATVPGYAKSEPDAYGKVTIGDWSADHAKKLISQAFGSRGLSVWAPESEEDAA